MKKLAGGNYRMKAITDSDWLKYIIPDKMSIGVSAESVSEFAADEGKGPAGDGLARVWKGGGRDLRNRDKKTIAFAHPSVYNIY